MPFALVSTFKCYAPPLGFENVDTVNTNTREYIITLILIELLFITSEATGYAELYIVDN